MSSIESMISVFKEANSNVGGKSVPLSLKTIRKRMGISHKKTKAIVYKAILEGKIKRVDPNKIGSNKYYRNTEYNKKDYSFWLSWIADMNNKKVPRKEQKNMYKTLTGEKKLDVFVLV